MDLLVISTGIGIVVSVMFSELFGLAAGGVIVPGYIALHLSNPLSVGLTLLIALITFALVHSASFFMVLYGRRRTALMILLGYFLGILLNHQVHNIHNMPIMPNIAHYIVPHLTPLSRMAPFEPFAAIMQTDTMVIGYIIPGLIAIWIDRQGIVKTLSSLLIAAVVVRLILLWIVGDTITP